MNRDQPPTEPLDLEALGLGAYAKKARAATFAPNWKSVLAADAFVGIAIVLLGVAATFWIPVIGWLLVVVGVVYIFLVVRRFLQWKWLRDQAGLS